jgi:hypothetical protein
MGGGAVTAALRAARVEPLFGTPRSSDRPTLGPRVTEVMRRQGKPAMPHQAHIFDVAFEIDPATGMLAYDEVVVIGPRQGTGKSEMVMAAMTYRCTGFDATLSDWCSDTFGVSVPEPGPQRVLYAAQNADEARKKWRNVHWARLGPDNPTSFYRNMVTATLQTNREQMWWENQSTWAPTSSTAKTGGTGDTTDMPVIDEAWSQKDSGLETAIKATTLTRPWSQFWILSMIPSLARVPEGREGWAYLAGKRDAGRLAVAAGQRSGVAFFDYCAAPDWETLTTQMDPYDPAVWYTCIPGLGYTVTEAGVRALSRAPLTEFAPELLGVEAHGGAKPASWDVVAEATWGTQPGEGLWDPDSRIAEGPFTRAFCIEMDTDRKYVWIVGAGKRDDGHWHVEVVEPGARVPQQTIGDGWVVGRATEMNTDWRPVVWTVVKGRPAESFAPQLRAAGLTVHVIPKGDMAGACGRMYDATGQRALDDAREGRLAPRTGPWTGVFHLGQGELADGWRNARKYDHGQGAFTLVNKAEGSQLCPLYGAIGAMEGFERFGTTRRKSAIY